MTPRKAPARERGVHREWIATAAAAVVVAAAWVVVLWIIRGMVAGLNSDQLYLANFAQDVFDGRPLRTWQLQPAPAYFPDLPLYLAATAATRDLGHAFALYASLALAALVGGAMALATAVGVSARRGAYAVAAFVFLLLPYAGQYNFYSPAHHGGTVVTFVYVLALAVGTPSHTSVRRLCGIGGLAFLGTVSDFFIVPQLLTPLCIALLVRAGAARGQGRRHILLRAAALGGGTAVGYGVFASRVGPLGTVPHFAISRPILEPGELVHLLRHLWRAATTSWPMLAILVVAAAGMAIVELLRRDRADERRSVLALFYLLALPAIIAAPAVALPADLYADRYLFSLLVIPVLLLFVASDELPRAARATVAVLAVAAWLSHDGLFHLRRAQWPTSIALRAAPPPRVACVDAFAAEHGIHTGFATYWEAGAITRYSRTGLHVLPIGGFVHADLWLANRDWFDTLERSSPGTVVVVVEGLDVERLQRRFGEPQAVATCEELTLHVYDFAKLTESQRAIFFLRSSPEVSISQ